MANTLWITVSLSDSEKKCTSCSSWLIVLFFVVDVLSSISQGGMVLPSGRSKRKKNSISVISILPPHLAVAAIRTRYESFIETRKACKRYTRNVCGRRLATDATSASTRGNASHSAPDESTTHQTPSFDGSDGFQGALGLSCVRVSCAKW